MDLRELEGGPNFRRDYLDVGEVANSSYEVATIKDFGIKSTDPFQLDDTATVSFGSGASNVPIFYHCRRGLYIDKDIELNDNGSIKYGAMAFMPEKEVKVLLLNNRAECVIGHADNKPRPCVNYFKMRFLGWEGQWHEVVYDVANQAEFSGEFPKDPKLTKPGERICGSREIQFATTIYYLGDWMFNVGPILYVLCIRSVGLPAMMTLGTLLYAAPYSKALADATRAIGKERDNRLSSMSLFSPVPQDIGYPGFYQQTAFSMVFQNRFLGTKIPQPRWIKTEFYVQDCYGD